MARSSSARTLGLVASVVVSALIAASCSRGPSSYSDSVRRNFMTGCQVVLAGGSDNVGSIASAAIAHDPAAAQHRSTCSCVYAAVSSGIPFKDFEALQAKVRRGQSLAADPSEPARKLRDYYSSCSSSASSDAPSRPTQGSQP